MVKRRASVTRLRVVGIGASAGGLAPLREMIAHIRVDTGHAFVVLQHLPPERTGELAKLLVMATKMPVVDVTAAMKIEPNTIYVVPPHTSAAVNHGVLVLKRSRFTASPVHVIDELFTSLAENLGERAVGVVLSGTGNDGSAGLRAIHDKGGVTCAQDPSTAQFDQMPRNAIATGPAGIVLPPAQLGDEMNKLETPVPRVASPEGARPAQERILEQLREASGVDFTSYKRNTIERRLARRLEHLRMSSLADYSAYLDEHPEEAAWVYDDLLVHVTEFFRDPHALDTLVAHACSDLVPAKRANAPIRVWVPGCSTGEEVYSIAMLLVERLGNDTPLQLFGSDLSEKSIETARRGMYPASSAARIGAERLERFFVPGEGGYRVKTELRERCVFARHDLVVDPPFSRLDIISCRNVFIYLAPALQNRVLPIFHYSLQKPGLLLLGEAESIAGFESLFSTVDANARLFARKPGERQVIAVSSASELGRQPWRRSAETMPRTVDIQRDVDHVLLARYSPPCVLVNDRFEVVHFRGRTSAFLEQPPGQPQLNILRLARGGIGAELAMALETAQRTDKAVRRENVALTAGRRIHVEVIPLGGTAGAKRYFLIIFEDMTSVLAARPVAITTKKQGENDEVGQLRQELITTKEYLHSIVTELTASIEEASFANDALQSANEELHSTNEQLQTTKEELQSTNEELSTVNDELAHNNDLLRELNDDLINVLSSVELAFIIVDHERKVRRFTPKARSVMKLLPGDIGRPIADLMPSVAIPDLDARIAHVIEKLEPSEAEVRHPDGTWYRMQIRPYRTVDNQINGATLTFIDITVLRGAREHAAAIVETAPIPLAVLDDRLVVRMTNHAFEVVYGSQLPEAELVTLEGFRSATLLDRLREVVATGTPFEGLDIEDDSAAERRVLRVGARRMAAFDGKERVLVGIADITERRRLERGNEAVELERTAFLDAVSHELRTPLSAILLWAEALREMPADDPARSQAIETIIDSTRLEAQLVDDLIDVALARSTELAIKVEPVRAGEITGEVLDGFRADTAQRSIVVERDIDTTGTILADPRRLRQIARGLISNAVKFTPDGGSIRVELSTLRGAMELRVRNSGPGLDPEFVHRLFAPFAKASEASKGIGIGLALVRHFVERHGGTIDVVSADAERGTTFMVRIPAHV